jgi:formyltetrahydrofolate deformylase
MGAAGNWQLNSSGSPPFQDVVFLFEHFGEASFNDFVPDGLAPFEGLADFCQFPLEFPHFHFVFRLNAPLRRSSSSSANNLLVGRGRLRETSAMKTAVPKFQKPSAILLISCPDRMGINAAVTRFILEHRGNIIDLDQHVDQQENVFFLRIEWDLDGFDLPRDAIEEAFRPLAGAFDMRAELRFSDRAQRMAVFVSRQGHCLLDLLARRQTGEWSVEIPVVISNHDDFREPVEQAGIEFIHLPVTRENKAAQERRQAELLAEKRVDFIVLARYMQILSGEFVSRYPHRIINIHHSFLPAFAGARPYHAAFARGVKLIGATSHYVTAELDAGPIIEQDLARVSHKDSVDDMVRKGRDLEKIVLSRAVWRHLNSQVLVYSNKTVIFE